MKKIFMILSYLLLTTHSYSMNDGENHQSIKVKNNVEFNAGMLNSDKSEKRTVNTPLLSNETLSQKEVDHMKPIEGRYRPYRSQPGSYKNGDEVFCGHYHFTGEIVQSYEEFNWKTLKNETISINRYYPCNYKGIYQIDYEINVIRPHSSWCHAEDPCWFDCLCQIACCYCCGFCEEVHPY